MASYNSFHVIGHLGQDAELKTFKNGASVIVFSLATTEYWKDKKGEKQTRTDWHRVEMNGDQGKNILAYLLKGKCVLVEGAIRYEEWMKEGQKQRMTKVRARKVVLLTPSGKTGPRAEEPVQAQEKPEPVFQAVDDDIPF